MVVRREEALVQALKAWGILAVAMIPAVIVGSAYFLLVVMLKLNGGHVLIKYILGDLLLVVVLGLPLAAFFTVLAFPFVPIRALLVRERFPYLRLGYLSVCLYGPALLLFVYIGDRQFAGFWLWVGLYEIVALTATLVFTPLARRFELLDL